MTKQAAATDLKIQQLLDSPNSSALFKSQFLFEEINEP